MTWPVKKQPGKGGSPSRKREHATLSANEAINTLFSHLGGKDQARLVQLWRHWPMVMGDMLAPLGFPLGHKEKTLLVGAEDAMALQELAMQSEEILERVNAFMSEAFFTKVNVSLMQNKPDLARPRPPAQQPGKPAPLPPPPKLGAKLAHMDPDSPVTRCYQAWMNRAEQKEKKD